MLCLGIIQSLFEGSMYTFVLEWTPALTPSESHHVDTSDQSALVAQTTDTSDVDFDDVDLDGHRGAIPHGFIFAAFMVDFLPFLKRCLLLGICLCSSTNNDTSIVTNILYK